VLVLNVQRVAGLAGVRPGRMPLGQSGQTGLSAGAGMGLMLLEEGGDIRVALQTSVFGCESGGMEDFM